MTRDGFLTQYWRYYLFLERDFIQMTRYIGLYEENFNVFSDEIHKQLISIGVEFENISKRICEVLGINLSDRANITHFNQWIPQEEIKVITIYSLDQFILLPFKIENGETQWKWWKGYNSIKHNRLFSYKEVTFKNLLDALSALFYAEMFLIKEIGESNNEVDVPDEYSKLFQIENWNTKYETLQGGERSAIEEEIDDMFKKKEGQINNE